MAEFYRSERRESIKVKKPSELGYSVAIVKMKPTLYSADAQLLFDHYRLTAVALFKLENTIRKWATEEEIEELQKTVYQELLGPLGEEVKELQGKYLDITLTKEQEDDVSFTQPYTEEVEITCPEARSLLNILIDFDKLVVRLFQLRFAYKITSADIFNVRRDTRGRLKGDEIKIERLVSKAITMARNKAKTEQEIAEVEAGVASLEALAGKNDEKAPGNGRRNGRGNGRKPLKTAPTKLEEPGKEDPGVGAETTLANLAEEAFSPFKDEPEAPEAAAATS